MAQPILPKNPDSPQSNAELFATVLALHEPGQNAVADELVEVCKLAMERKPNDPITREVLDTTINTRIVPSGGAARPRCRWGGPVKQRADRQRVISRNLKNQADHGGWDASMQFQTLIPSALAADARPASAVMRTDFEKIHGLACSHLHRRKVLQAPRRRDTSS